LMADQEGAFAPAADPPPWLLEGPPDDHPFNFFGREETSTSSDLPAAPRLPSVDGLGWEALAERVSTCTGCELHRTRTRTVFGVGDRQARLMVIGEAPGAGEDLQGEPFVGRAGQLLTAILRAVGLQREHVYIANILKCRPPGNRDPHIDEIGPCRPYLSRQIALVRPRVIVAVGRIAAQYLLSSEQPVGRLRGTEHRFGENGIPLVVSYHPAYLLRTPEQKGAAWQDWQRAVRLLREQ
jgi:uracil-DNA glycosylase